MTEKNKSYYGSPPAGGKSAIGYQEGHPGAMALGKIIQDFYAECRRILVQSISFTVKGGGDDPLGSSHAISEILVGAAGFEENIADSILGVGLGFGVGGIMKTFRMSPLLRVLRDHPVRVKGFAACTQAQRKDFLEKMYAYCESIGQGDMSARIAETWANVEKGAWGKATADAETVVSHFHQGEIDAFQVLKNQEELLRSEETFKSLAKDDPFTPSVGKGAQDTGSWVTEGGETKWVSAAGNEPPPTQLAGKKTVNEFFQEEIERLSPQIRQEVAENSRRQLLRERELKAKSMTEDLPDVGADKDLLDKFGLSPEQTMLDREQFLLKRLDELSTAGVRTKAQARIYRTTMDELSDLIGSQVPRKKVEPFLSINKSTDDFLEERIREIMKDGVRDKQTAKKLRDLKEMMVARLRDKRPVPAEKSASEPYSFGAPSSRWPMTENREWQLANQKLKQQIRSKFERLEGESDAAFEARFNKWFEAQEETMADIFTKRGPQAGTPYNASAEYNHRLTKLNQAMSTDSSPILDEVATSRIRKIIVGALWAALAAAAAAGTSWLISQPDDSPLKQIHPRPGYGIKDEDIPTPFKGDAYKKLTKSEKVLLSSGRYDLYYDKDGKPVLIGKGLTPNEDLGPLYRAKGAFWQEGLGEFEYDIAGRAHLVREEEDEGYLDSEDDDDFTMSRKGDRKKLYTSISKAMNLKKRVIADDMRRAQEWEVVDREVKRRKTKAADEEATMTLKVKHMQRLEQQIHDTEILDAGRYFGSRVGRAVFEIIDGKEQPFDKMFATMGRFVVTHLGEKASTLLIKTAEDLLMKYTPIGKLFEKMSSKIEKILEKAVETITGGALDFSSLLGGSSESIGGIVGIEMHKGGQISPEHLPSQNGLPGHMINISFPYPSSNNLKVTASISEAINRRLN
jgi:hypothetical protein